MNEISRSLARALDNGSRRAGLKLMSLKLLRETPREAAEAAIRLLCAAVRMGDETTLCRALGRYKMFVDNADFGLAPHLLLDGFWEMWVTRAMLEVVHPGMVAVDVGANVGYFTLLLADIVGPDGRVLAFEPNPRPLHLLERSLRLNGLADRVALHGVPLAATSGNAVYLVVPVGEPKNAHLSPEADSSAGHALHSATLDDVVGDGRVDFVKIDAEGAERDIWQGMQRIVARGQPMTVFLEFVADRYAAPDALLAEFAGRGFHLRRIDPRRGMIDLSAREVLDAPAGVDQMLVLSR